MKKIFFLFFAVLFLSGCGQKAVLPSYDIPAGQKIPLATVAEHKAAEDCWLIINNNVYNVTDYIASHPGGAAIIKGCGQDATNLFETRPSGSKTPHSDKAREKLAEYYIGDAGQ